MRRAWTLLFLGIWVAVLPYLGFPQSWKNILFTVLGLVLIYISFVLYSELKAKEKKKDFDNFSENQDFSKTEDTMVIEEHIEIKEETI